MSISHWKTLKLKVVLVTSVERLSGLRKPPSEVSRRELTVPGVWWDIWVYLELDFAPRLDCVYFYIRRVVVDHVGLLLFVSWFEGRSRWRFTGGDWSQPRASWRFWWGMGGAGSRLLRWGSRGRMALLLQNVLSFVSFAGFIGGRKKRRISG